MSDAEVANVADVEQVAKAERRRKRRVDEATADLSWLTAQPQFVRFAQCLIASCGLYKSTFDADSHARMALREGQRNIGLKVIADIEKVNPTVLLHIITTLPPEKETTNA